jgi:hypothetical protein
MMLLISKSMAIAGIFPGPLALALIINAEPSSRAILSVASVNSYGSAGWATLLDITLILMSSLLVFFKVFCHDLS